MRNINDGIDAIRNLINHLKSVKPENAKAREHIRKEIARLETVKLQLEDEAVDVSERDNVALLEMQRIRMLTKIKELGRCEMGYAWIYRGRMTAFIMTVQKPCGSRKANNDNMNDSNININSYYMNCAIHTLNPA